MKQIIQSKSKCITVVNTIYGEPTHGSFGDYILLKDYYKSREDAYADSDRKIVLFHHFNFLLKEKVRNHKLKCTYCGKDNLYIQPVGLKMDQSRVATVDHFYLSMRKTPIPLG